jgi:hypothetical protein
VRRATAIARLRGSQFGPERDEGGSVLILVIAILVAVGILVGALAALAGPMFAQAEVARNLNDTGAAIDAGIEHGIQTLQATIPALLFLCPSPPRHLTVAQVPPVPPAPSNNYVAIVQCQLLPSSVSGTSEIVFTSTLPPTAPGVGGRVYSARAVVEVNNFTGATTILSWKTCQDPGPC